MATAPRDRSGKQRRDAKSAGRVRAAVIEALEGRLLFTVAPNFTSADTTSVAVNASVSFLVTTSPAATKINEEGTLPAGLKFTDNGDGTATIFGVPTSAGGSGVFRLKFSAQNSGGTNSQQFTLDVESIPKITNLQNAVFNTVSGGTFTIKTANFGAGVPTLSIADMPAGATFVDNGDGTGTLTVPPGSVVAPGYYATDNEDALMVSASNLAGGVIQQLFLTVDDAPTFTSAASDTINLDQAALFDVTTTGFPISQLQLAGNLPKGLTFKNTPSGTNHFTGAATISGTPMQTGVFKLILIANNRLGSPVKQDFLLTVTQAPGFSTAAMATFTVGKAGKFKIKTQGFPPSPITEFGALPSGITFTDNGNGTAELLGTPAGGTAGVYHFTLFSDGGAVSQLFTLTIE